MASKAETSKAILRLSELSEEQYTLNITLENLLEEILNHPNPRKQLFDDLEKYETRETEIILEKKQIREELVSLHYIFRTRWMMIFSNKIYRQRPRPKPF